MIYKKFNLPSALGTALAATSADAQASATAAAANTSKTTKIIVRAQRRRESLQKTPVSLTAATADIIQSRQIIDRSQISSGGSFSVRGFGTLTFVSTVNSSVALAPGEVTQPAFPWIKPVQSGHQRNKEF